MYGIEAIEANNGWAMAVTGAIIVMTGLAALSFIISQLHRIIALFEDRASDPDPEIAPEPEPQPSFSPLEDLDETARRFRPFTLEIGDPFDLTDLFPVLVQSDDPHPHLTIRSLREQGYLVPVGNGRFTWKQT